jgi:hypothetical protein
VCAGSPTFAIEDDMILGAGVPNRRRFTVSVVLSLLTFVTIACGRRQPSIQAALQRGGNVGSLLVEVVEARRGGDDYWNYRITPTTGEVAMIGDGRRLRGMLVPTREPTGHASCYQETSSSSPDGRFVATCSNASESQAQFVVQQNEKVIFAWKPQMWRGVDGFMWSPTSRAIAVLRARCKIN